MNTYPALTSLTSDAFEQLYWNRRPHVQAVAECHTEGRAEPRAGASAEHSAEVADRSISGTASNSFAFAPEQNDHKPVRRGRLGLTALMLSGLGLLGASACAAINGALITHMEAGTPDGYYSQMPPDAFAMANGIFAVLFVFAVIALPGFVSGIVALVRGRDRGAGVAAVVVAPLAVPAAFAAFLGGVFAAAGGAG